MAGLGEVAVWSFDLASWGECTQAPSEALALEKFAQRSSRSDLVVEERITGPDQVFDRDYRPATDDEIDTALRKLKTQRSATIELITRAGATGALDAQDISVVQPAWMTWRTPRAIAEHLIADACGAYLKRLALPVITPRGELIDDLVARGIHLQHVLQDMPRDRVTNYKGGVWTSVKFLRRQAWHEGLEQVFLRRRLRAAGVIISLVVGRVRDLPAQRWQAARATDAAISRAVVLGLSWGSATGNHQHVRFRRAKSEPSRWDSLSRQLAEARAVVLDGPVTDRRVLLTSLSLSEHSTLGALVANCGGVVIDHGWLRMFAGGSAAMPSLTDANLDGGHSSGDHLVVAFDILGGRFAINGSGERAAPGEVCYLAPDTLEWLNLEMGHTEFVHWALGDNLEQLYRDLRWPGWEHEIAELAFDQGLATYPPPFAAEGSNMAATSRSAVPAAELFYFIDEAARQLAAVPNGETFEFKFGD